MPKNSTESLKHYAQQTLLQRLLIMTLVISMVVSVIVYVLEQQRMQEYVIEQAIIRPSGWVSFRCKPWVNFKCKSTHCRFH
jgi:hypothetical protein